MTQKKDIKELMRDYTPTAPENGWENVSEKLAQESVQDIRESMEEFQPAVDTAKWKSINQRLIVNRFFTFNRKQFNIFYLLILLLFISGVGILAATNIFKNNIYQPLAYNEGTSPINNADTLKNNTVGNTDPNTHILNDKLSGNALAGQSETPSNGTVADLYYVAPTNTNPNNNSQTGNENSSNSTSVNNTNTNETRQENSAETRTALKFMPKLKLIPIHRAVSNLLSIGNFTPLPDTLGIDAFGDPILSEKPKLAISLGMYGNYNTNIYNLSDNPELLIENQSIANIFNNRSSGSFGHGFDLSLDFIDNQFILSSGISYQQINRSFSSNIPTTHIDSTGYYDYFENSRWQYDTTYYINIDTLAITGDTIYSPYIDSTWAAFQDSSLAYEIDSTNGTKLINEREIVRYISIPIWVGYRESTENWELHAQLGLITSIPIYQQMTWYNLERNEFIYSKNAPLSNILLTAGFRAYFARKLNKNCLVGIEPSYFYRLNPLFDKDYPIDTKQHVFRVGFKIQYQF
ncbi:MAG: hypothetical protein U9N51_05630 [Bacteroidota bacterium]|nr:hypothetical protein [Bacteroidota bacterium]